MKQFNLQLALDGFPVITRDGREVTQITRFNCACANDIACVINNQINLFNKYGEHNFFKDGHWHRFEDLDLFMKPTKKQGWVNVFNDLTCSSIFLTEHEALLVRKRIHIDVGCIDTIMIEWEE